MEPRSVVALRRWYAQSGHTRHADAAAAIGISRSRLTQLLLGIDPHVSRKTAQKLSGHTGIALEVFGYARAGRTGRASA